MVINDSYFPFPLQSKKSYTKALCGRKIFMYVWTEYKIVRLKRKRQKKFQHETNLTVSKMSSSLQILRQNMKDFHRGCVEINFTWLYLNTAISEILRQRLRAIKESRCSCEVFHNPEDHPSLPKQFWEKPFRDLIHFFLPYQLTLASWYVAIRSKSFLSASLASNLKRLSIAALQRRLAM